MSIPTNNPISQMAPLIEMLRKKYAGTLMIRIWPIDDKIIEELDEISNTPPSRKEYKEIAKKYPHLLHTTDQGAPDQDERFIKIFICDPSHLNSQLSQDYEAEFDIDIFTMAIKKSERNIKKESEETNINNAKNKLIYYYDKIINRTKCIEEINKINTPIDAFKYNESQKSGEEHSPKNSEYSLQSLRSLAKEKKLIIVNDDICIPETPKKITHRKGRKPLLLESVIRPCQLSQGIVSPKVIEIDSFMIEIDAQIIGNNDRTKDHKKHQLEHKNFVCTTNIGAKDKKGGYTEIIAYNKDDVDSQNIHDSLEEVPIIVLRSIIKEETNRNKRDKLIKAEMDRLTFYHDSLSKSALKSKFQKIDTAENSKVIKTQIKKFISRLFEDNNSITRALEILISFDDMVVINKSKLKYMIHQKIETEISGKVKECPTKFRERQEPLCYCDLCETHFANCMRDRKSSEVWALYEDMQREFKEDAEEYGEEYEPGPFKEFKEFECQHNIAKIECDIMDIEENELPCDSLCIGCETSGTCRCPLQVRRYKYEEELYFLEELKYIIARENFKNEKTESMPPAMSSVGKMQNLEKTIRHPDIILNFRSAEFTIKKIQLDPMFDAASVSIIKREQNPIPKEQKIIRELLGLEPKLYEGEVQIEFINIDDMEDIDDKNIPTNFYEEYLNKNHNYISLVDSNADKVKLIRIIACDVTDILQQRIERPWEDITIKVLYSEINEVGKHYMRKKILKEKNKIAYYVSKSKINWLAEVTGKVSSIKYINNMLKHPALTRILLETAHENKLLSLDAEEFIQKIQDDFIEERQRAMVEETEKINLEQKNMLESSVVKIKSLKSNIESWEQKIELVRKEIELKSAKKRELEEGIFFENEEVPTLEKCNPKRLEQELIGLNNPKASIITKINGAKYFIHRLRRLFHRAKNTIF